MLIEAFRYSGRPRLDSSKNTMADGNAMVSATTVKVSVFTDKRT